MMYASPKNSRLLFDKKYSRIINEYFKIPEGRSFPLDLPRTGADCCPAAIAAYLGISTKKAIKMMPSWKEGKGSSTRDIVTTLNSVNMPHEVIDSYYGTKSLKRISKNYTCGFIEAEFVKKGGKELYVGHLCAFDHNKKGDLMIYDNNAQLLIQTENDILVQGFWLNEKIWSKNIVTWARDIFPTKPVKDYYITRIIVPRDN